MTYPRIPIPGQSITSTWARQLCEYLRQTTIVAGRGVVLSRSPGGTLVEAAKSASNVASAASASPFTVRWVDFGAEDGNSGEWQIYLPIGSATMDGEMCKPKDMEAGKSSKGKELYGWYRIDDPKDEDGEIASLSGGLSVVSWEVRCVFKPWPRFKAVTSKTDDFGKGVVTLAVAAIRACTATSGGKSRTSHTVDQYITGTRNLESGIDYDSKFAIKWKSDKSAYDDKAEFEPYVTNQALMVGAKQLTIDDDTPIDGFEEVYVKINHADDYPTIEITGTREESDADKTVIKIYTMGSDDDGNEDMVAADLREDLASLPFYA